MNLARSTKRLLLAAGSVILALALIAFFWARLTAASSGPKYDGKTLRQWIMQMDSSIPSVRRQAIASIRQIGTNALPTLSEWMAHRDTDSERQIYHFLVSKRALVSWWPALMRNSEDRCEYMALLGFYALGPDASPALPFLEQLVCEDAPASPAKPLNAARACVYIAPSRAQELAQQWNTSTNQQLILAGGRLTGALASVARATAPK